MLNIERLDHLVLTVNSIDNTIQFYCDILGMELVVFGNKRKALKFGQQKFNLHQYRDEFEPKAQQPTSGAADLCLITKQSLIDWATHFKRHDIAIIEGPVMRTGAIGTIESIYIRDPDGNLIEISRYIA